MGLWPRRHRRADHRRSPPVGGDVEGGVGRSGEGVVPVLVVDGGDPFVGEAAVRWLGDELKARAVDVEAEPCPPATGRQPHLEVPDLSWTTQQGSRWNRAYQDAGKAGLLMAR